MRSSDDDVLIVGAGLRTAAGSNLAAVRGLWERNERLVPQASTAAGRLDQAAVAREPLFEVELERELEAQVKFLNGSGRMAIQAAHEAMAGLGALSSLPSERRSLYLAQMDSYDWDAPELRPGVLAATESGARALTDESLNRAAVRKVKPFFLLESLKNNAFAFLSTWLDLRGPNTGVAGYGGDSAPLLELALRGLARGRSDQVLFVAAARPTSPVGRLERAQHPGLARAAAPGDGAAALTFVRRSSAHALSLVPWARVGGIGLATGRARAEGDVDDDAVERAARLALEESGISAGALTACFAPAAAGPGLARAGLKDAPLHDSAERLGDTTLAQLGVDLALAADALRRAGRAPLAAPGPLLVVEPGWLQQAAAVVLIPAR